jgi:CHASE3 domain sensor protein
VPVVTLLHLQEYREAAAQVLDYRRPAVEAVAAKTVQAHQGARAVEPVLVVLMPVKQPAQATHHPQVPHRAIPEQSVLVTAVAVAVVLDLLVWAAAAQALAATVAQVIPGWMV